LEENLIRHVRVLSGEIGERNFIQYENLEKAKDYIIKVFKDYGYSTEEQIYPFQGREFKNIIAVKSGESDKIIIVGAHYDSVIGSPGADDNASAVAGLLELARILKEEKLSVTIKFIAFTNEEPPFFLSSEMGSMVYAKEAKRKKEKIEAMLCLESIGYYSDKRGSQSYPLGLNLFYPDKGDFIGIVGNLRSKRLVRDIKEILKKQNIKTQTLVCPSFLVPAIEFSDNSSFWRKGFKAVMITDTAFYRNPYYHTQDDTPDKINYKKLEELVYGLKNVIMELAK
jgi:Zn-dependent M28 family amino/carboxypeptidase